MGLDVLEKISFLPFAKRAIRTIPFILRIPATNVLAIDSLHRRHLPDCAPRVLIYPVNQLISTRHLAFVLA